MPLLWCRGRLPRSAEDEYRHGKLASKHKGERFYAMGGQAGVQTITRLPFLGTQEMPKLRFIEPIGGVDHVRYVRRKKGEQVF